MASVDAAGGGAGQLGGGAGSPGTTKGDMRSGSMGHAHSGHRGGSS
jgi:hypothetical protein